MRTILALLAACAALATGPAWAADKSPGMDMHGMDMPGMKSMPATTRAFTEGHRFRIDLLTVPAPLPLQKYFELQLAVFDGRHPARRLTDASIKVSAGMTHGMGHEFMHGMQSTPLVEAHAGRYIVRGMYLHMQGPWTLRVHVREGGHSGTADLTLQCCGG
ncbi:MAG TPA: hypothetical protein VGM97_17600 [Steroidobacteraceae bacterium]|jgi:hypothetical protein